MPFVPLGATLTTRKSTKSFVTINAVIEVIFLRSVCTSGDVLRVARDIIAAL